MKKASYKHQIERELVEQGWEVISIDSSAEWWDDEHWRVESKHHPKLSFYLCFIVDPMWEGRRFKGQGILEIKATTAFPETWNDDVNKIASLHMHKGLFTDNLNSFLGDLEDFMGNG